MAGIYIHIPFCKKACYYCDFHFVASLKNKDVLVKALIRELEVRSKDWADQSFDTVYFGGGTPSILDIAEIEAISKAVYDNYKVESDFEFTMEANPDDLDIEYLEKLRKKTDINRFSLGVQSFRDDILQFLNRRHDSKQAYDSILNLHRTGFENITLDLIYGIPGLSADDWRNALDTFLTLNIDHLSAYHLTIEPKTVFSVWQKKGKFKQIEEEESLKHYEVLINFARENGYEHYEISNFARNKRYSKHNTSYWKGTPYLGIGPSAHSYQGMRRWNIAHNTKYITAIEAGTDDYFGYENLSPSELYNDYILTALRTKWGAKFDHIKEKIGAEFLDHSQKVIEKIAEKDKIQVDSEGFHLTEKGWFIADYLMAEFFVV